VIQPQIAQKMSFLQYHKHYTFCINTNIPIILLLILSKNPFRLLGHFLTFFTRLTKPHGLKRYLTRLFVFCVL